MGNMNAENQSKHLLNLTSLENALRQLEDGMDKMTIDPNDELRRDGVIQRFEYSMDLAWKLIQRYLKVYVEAVFERALLFLPDAKALLEALRHVN